MVLPPENISNTVLPFLKRPNTASPLSPRPPCNVHTDFRDISPRINFQTPIANKQTNKQTRTWCLLLTHRLTDRCGRLREYYYLVFLFDNNIFLVKNTYQTVTWILWTISFSYMKFKNTSKFYISLSLVNPYKFPIMYFKKKKLCMFFYFSIVMGNHCTPTQRHFSRV